MNWFNENHINHHVSKMETRNHFKNGAQPKSQTSRKIKLKQMKKLLLIVCALVAMNGMFSQTTVDARLKKKEADGVIRIITREHTRDACDKSCDVTFTSTTDGNVVVRPGETKYFKIHKDMDDYTRSGGYYWKCCNTAERSRISGATYIKVVRKADTGAFDQYWVEIELIDD